VTDNEFRNDITLWANDEEEDIHFPFGRENGHVHDAFRKEEGEELSFLGPSTEVTRPNPPNKGARSLGRFPSARSPVASPVSPVSSDRSGGSSEASCAECFWKSVWSSAATDVKEDREERDAIALHEDETHEAPSREDENDVVRLQEKQQEEEELSPKCMQALPWVRWIRSGITRREFWNPREDALLIQLKHNAPRASWSEISDQIPQRSWKQCCNRWAHLKKLRTEGKSGKTGMPSWRREDTTGTCDPLSRSVGKMWVPWTLQEDCLLIQCKQQSSVASWREISASIPGRSDHQCRNRWAYFKYTIQEMKKRGGIMENSERTQRTDRRKWTTDEDALLVDQKRKHPNASWRTISQNIPNRSDRQCAYRWTHIRKKREKEINREEDGNEREIRWTLQWTPEEDALLLRLRKEEPLAPWTQLADRVQGRTAYACLNRWKRICLLPTT